MRLYHSFFPFLGAVSAASFHERTDNGVPQYKDASLSPIERANDLLGRMNWEEKVGQMGGVRRLAEAKLAFNRSNYEAFVETQNGILGYGSMYNAPLDLLPIANQVRMEQVNSTRLGIPWITVTDSVNSIYLVNGTLFPATLSMGCTFNIPLYKQVVQVLRDENRALGTYWVLSPELDLAKEPRGGRVGEMYGEDAYLVGSFGSQYVKTMEEKNEQGYIQVATTIKHFVYAQNQGGVNLASINAGINWIMNDLALPFWKVIKEANPLSLMASYSSVDQIPMSANQYMLQDILRDTLGFKGLIMSDAFGISNMFTAQKTATSAQDAAVQALEAGLALELSPGKPGYFPTLMSLENDTRIVELVDKAVHQILMIKLATGVFEQPLASEETIKKTLRAESHLEVNRNVSREAIVLLQNDGVLPLPSNSSQKVAVLGPFASLINAGSYAPEDPIDSATGSGLIESLQEALGADKVKYVQGCDIVLTNNTSGIDEAVSAAEAAGLAVLMLGSLSTSADPYMQSKRTDGEFYSHADLGFPGLQQQLLDSVLDTGVPTVVILSGGQAFALSNSTLRSNAILHSFLAGEYTADSLVEILYGRVNPSGKLPVSLPQASGATTAYYDFLPSDSVLAGPSGNGSTAWQWPQLQRESPFTFGYGLSYTTFAVSAPTLTTTNTTVQISTSVTNTGNITGKEVVQVYFRPKYTRTIEFPVRRLTAFAKYELQPGETKDITFSVNKEELGYWVYTKYHVYPGEYEFWVGTSSRKQDLKNATITL
ncbi:periplasmic beta-glucosidase [Lophiotrema nucula]|uniref:beta-glucosidase n=1 Tax=Lophiotrema nucula TaxID=690887 RepID=A0A6A5ZG05_9PLEO|nr:periplasmic beta-glucosidase [Lophiotrema nucula]